MADALAGYDLGDFLEDLGDRAGNFAGLEGFQVRLKAPGGRTGRRGRAGTEQTEEELEHGRSPETGAGLSSGGPCRPQPVHARNRSPPDTRCWFFLTIGTGLPQ